MQVFMVLCEWYEDVTVVDHAYGSRTGRQMSDWSVFYKKEQAMNFVKETFEGSDYYDTEVREGLQRIAESFEPQSFHPGFKCLEQPSWIIGNDRTAWSATISPEELEH